MDIGTCISLIIISFITAFVLGIILKGCIDYRKEMIEEAKLKKDLEESEKNKPKDIGEISLTELTNFIVDTIKKEEDNKPIDVLVSEWLNDIVSPNMLKDATPYVEIEQGPCKGCECNLSPVGADHCVGDNGNGWKTGKCIIKLNLSNLVGATDKYEKPKADDKEPAPVTAKEAAEMAKALTTYFEKMGI